MESQLSSEPPLSSEPLVSKYRYFKHNLPGTTKLVHKCSSGTEYTFVASQPTKVLAEDANELLSMVKLKGQCCGGTRKIPFAMFTETEIKLSM